MSFLNLWWAAGIAAIVVPVLLILYFLKLRRREQLVSSTLLWKRAVQDLQVNVPFQRLRKNLLLFLQLLILAAAILALARPIIHTELADQARVVILIDRSASMNAREGEETRLDQAKEEAVRLVRSLNRPLGRWWSLLSFGQSKPQTQVMVIAFADRATVVSPFTTNTGQLVDLIRRIEPTDGQTDLSEALELAQAYMASAGPGGTETEAAAAGPEFPAKLILISDGKLPRVGKTVSAGSTLELIRVGRAQDNVGITALRAQRSYERPENVDVLLTVRNFGPRPIETDLSVYLDGTIRSVRTLRLAQAGPVGAEPPRSSDESPALADTQSLGFSLPLDRAAVVEARLSRRDALSVDNSAFAVIPPPRKLRVLVVSDGRYPFFGSVIRALPLEEFPFVTPAEYEKRRSEYSVDGQSAFDVVVFDKYSPDRLPAGNYLFLGAVPNVEGIQIGPASQNHGLVWWDETHPVLRHAALEYVYVAESRTVTLPPRAQVLAEGPDGPVLFRYAVDGRQYLVLTFAVESSTWWSKLSFVIFMYNAIRYLGGSESEIQPDLLRPGATLRIPVPPASAKVKLFRPDGAKVTLVPDSSGLAYYGGTERVGLYRVEGGLPGRDRFAVNLVDESESDIAPPTAPLVLDHRQVRELASSRTATPEVWRWFIGAALLLVLLEWWIYNRRVMI